MRGSVEILRRIIDERARVEARVHSILVMRRPPMPVVNAAAVDTVIAQSPWGLKVGAPAMTPQAGSSSVDIERLTEQVVRNIDRQIVAYRERMGRVF